jgi:hypothetical protein
MGRGDYWPSTGKIPCVNERPLQAVDFSQPESRVTGVMTNAGFWQHARNITPDIRDMIPEDPSLNA